MLNAVFTGDLVQSSRLSGAQINAAMDRMARFLNDRVPTNGRFTRFRGDGWQALLPDPSQALEAAITLIAALRTDGIATRISIGVGEVEHPGTADLSDARGAAFIASGHALDAMQKGQLLAIAGTPVKKEDTAIVVLLNERISRWSREQAEAVELSSDPWATTDKESAKKLGITPQAMSERLYNAGYPSMLYAITLWRDAKIEQGWVDP
jgi:hypothetical protein